MPVNFNMLSNIASNKPQVYGQIGGNVGGGDGGIGDFFNGLSSLVKGFKSQPQQAAQPDTSIMPGGTIDQTSNNILNVGQQPTATTNRLQQVVEQSGVFQNAMKQLGLKEGDSALSAYLTKANPNLDPKTTPWCAGYVGSVLNASGMKGTGSLAAKSYLKFGNPTNNPTQGDIVVLNRTNNPELGHVGFVYGINQEKGTVSVLGGNQGNSVSIKEFPLNQVAGFRTPPTGQQVQQFAQQNNIQNPQQLSQLPIQVNKQQAQSDLPHVMAGIAGVESSGAKNPYTLISKPSRNGDRAYGKYQIMGNNIPAWSKEAGMPMTKEQFLANPDAQEKIASYHIGKILNKYKNPDDAYSVWFSGRPVNKAGNAKDVYGTTVPAYIKKANQYFLKSKAGAGDQMKMTLDSRDNGLVPRQLLMDTLKQLSKPISPQAPINNKQNLASLGDGHYFWNVQEEYGKYSVYDKNGQRAPGQKWYSSANEAEKAAFELNKMRLFQ